MSGAFCAIAETAVIKTMNPKAGRRIFKNSYGAAIPLFTPCGNAWPIEESLCFVAARRKSIVACRSLR
jgi:hypothetical protein